MDVELQKTNRTRQRNSSAMTRTLLNLAIGIGAFFSLALPAYGMHAVDVDIGLDAGRAIEAGATVTPQSTPDIPEYDPPSVSYARPPLYEVPRSMRAEDHYYLMRPIQSGNLNWPSPYYRYGSTLFGRGRLHTGVDMAVDLGTPIVAAGSGHVIWTGIGFSRGVYVADDPYGQAIAIRHDFGYADQNLFTVYGHLNSIAVWPGQRVEAGQVIGTVGSTGLSTGPHLHFEVRLGDSIYAAVQNPELWMSMPEGWGVLSGRLEDDWGRSLHERRLRIVSLDTSQKWDVWTYATDTLGTDPLYQENFAISDLPAGRYRLEVEYRWKTYAVQLDLLPGQTSYIVFRGRSGFFINPELESGNWAPPIP